MTRNLKALGLALLAAFAMSAVAASAASADIFKSGEEDTVLTASGSVVNHTFSYGIGTVECKVTNFTATAPTTEETEIKATPTYDECEFLEEPAVVRMNHCYYVFTSHTDPETGDAPVHVECEGEEHIEVEVPSLGGCTVTIAGGQTTGGGVIYTNKGEGTTKDVVVDVTATVAATRDNPTSNFFCSLLPGSGTGAYEGSSTLRGYKYAGGPEKVWTEEDGHETTGTGTTHWIWEEGVHVPISVEGTP